MHLQSACIARIGIVTLIIALTPITAIRARADLTGQQILQKCQQAYKSLKSYRGKTTVASGDSPDITSASVEYVHPGKIRVDGTLTESGTFAFVSDGLHTWEKSSLSDGKWQKAESTEMAIAGFTGVSGRAATTIPAILTGGNWGNPFTVNVTSVSDETIGGIAAYKLTCTNTLGNVTFSIDKKTFLLMKIHSIFSVPEMDLSQPPGTQPVPKPNGKTIRLESIETFTNVRINETIAAATFLLPTR